MDARFEQLIAKLGYECTEAEAQTVFDAVSKPPSDPMAAMMMARGGWSLESGLDEAIARAGTGPFTGPSGEASFTVGGTVAAGYEAVRSAFTNNFKKGLERDAQVRIALALDMRASR